MRVARAQDDDGHVLVDERDGAVLHLPGRIALGVDVRDLFELERALERDREAGAAAQKQHVRRVHVASSRGAAARRPSASTSRIWCGASVSASRMRRASLGQRAAAAPEVNREQEHRDELRREALGRGDADFGAGVRVERGVAGAGDGAVDDVRDGEDVRALGLRGLTAAIVSSVSPLWLTATTRSSGPKTGSR